MDKWMDEGRVCIPEIVLAELIQGAKTEAEVKAVEELRDSFLVVDLKPGTWIDAGRVSRSLRKKGKTIHLTDCVIGMIAFQHKCAVLTFDAHFADIRSVLNIELIDVKN